jgi:hypothetical protein
MFARNRLNVNVTRLLPIDDTYIDDTYIDDTYIDDTYILRCQIHLHVSSTISTHHQGIHKRIKNCSLFFEIPNLTLYSNNGYNMEGKCSKKIKVYEI